MAFRLAAIALAVLSCTASAANVNIHNNLDDVTIQYRNPATDKVGQIAPGDSASVPMHAGNGRVDLFRKNPLNANAMFIHYQRGQKVLQYSVSSGPNNNPFILEERTITPSVAQTGKSNCVPIVCKEESTKCEMKKKHCSIKSPKRSDAVDIDLDVEIGESYSDGGDDE